VMVLQRRRRDDPLLLALFEESGRNVQQATVLLCDLLTEWPERAELARDLFLCEQEGDRITHDIIHRLAQADGGPLESSDAHRLATSLDDVVDFAEQAADQLGLYHVEATMEQAVSLAWVLRGAGASVAEGLRALRTGSDLSVHLREIHRLENEGDRLSRDAVASLFAGGIDPMVVIRWKDIFDGLEASIDACETVAHVLEGIALKHGQPPA
jgi:uncharacterized protein Yka (UPF0111/DUF47 family)